MQKPLGSGARLVACATLFAGLGACGIHEEPFGYDTRPVNTTCKPPARPSSDVGIQLTQLWSTISFSSPVAFMQAPGEPDRFYVVEQTGKVRAMTLTDTDATDVVAYTGNDIVTGGEMGLLGLAFAPDWTSSHTAYVSRDIPGGPTGQQSLLTRIKSTDGGKTFDRATEEPLLTIEQPFTNHKGGNIIFGPDGYLYFGLGDGGSGGDPMGNGQNLSVMLGKMLRLDVSMPGAYQVPPDNPFVGMAGKLPEIWAYGLRNPWRWSFDRMTGDQWVGDVGQDKYEEVDIIQRGGNYGWNTREGLHCYNADTCATTGFIDPIWEYPHSEGVAVTGGYVYRGSAIPALAGIYLFADYGSGKLWGLFPNMTDGALAAQELLTTGFNVSSFGEDLAGEVYVVDLSGKIWKITPSGTPGAIGFPQKLSQVGCMKDGDPSQPSDALIPYFVNVPFWSDGADKQRWIAFPESGKATIQSDGDIDLPIGTVLVKHFSVNEQLIETRLFVRHDDGGWAGYTYAWDDDGKDATLVVGGKKRALSSSQVWLYPSGAECMQCHSPAAGYSLGLELRQLNTIADYPATNRRSPQLDTWEHMGLFDSILPSEATAPGMGPAPPETQVALPTITGDDQSPVSPDARARAYLHVNCGFCHRPNGNGEGPHDLRIDRTFAETNLCNTDPQLGNLGDAAAKLLVPGAPEHSILSLRMHATNSDRMPPIASRLVDSNGASIIDAWISSIPSCPQ